MDTDQTCTHWLFRPQSQPQLYKYSIILRLWAGLQNKTYYIIVYLLQYVMFIDTFLTYKTRPPKWATHTYLTGAITEIFFYGQSFKNIQAWRSIVQILPMPGPLSSLYKVFSVRSGTRTNCTCMLVLLWSLYTVFFSRTGNCTMYIVQTVSVFQLDFCDLCAKCSSWSQVHVQTVLICWFFCNLCPMCFSCDQIIVLVQTVLLRVLS